MDPSPPCPCRGKGGNATPYFFGFTGASAPSPVFLLPPGHQLSLPSIHSPFLQPPHSQCPHLLSTHPSNTLSQGLSRPWPHGGCWRPSSHKAQELLTSPHRHSVTLPHPPRSPPTGPQALRPGTGIQKEAMVPHLNICSDQLSAPPGGWVGGECGGSRFKGTRGHI